MKTVIVIIGVIGAIGAAIFSYYGLFAPINIQEKELGPYVVFTKKHIGPYKDVGTVLEEFRKELKDDSLEPEIAVGIYYDNPKLTAEQKTRSVLGYVIEGVDRSRMMELEKKYSSGELPETKYLVVEFPYKGLPSIVIGVYRVYPKIRSYMKNKEMPDMPIIEIYNSKVQKMYYLVPIGVNPYFFDKLLENAAS